MKTFGQEFHPHEAIRALRVAEKIKTGDRKLLTQRIADELPQPEKSTRERIASKLIQRYLKATRSKIAPWSTQHFAQLVSKTRHAPTQIELLYFQLTQTDAIVGHLARALFYPVFVLQKAPLEYSDEEFAINNGSRLAGNEPLLTRQFIRQHAREKWNFPDGASVDRALRVLQGAGLIARERMTELQNHPDAFRLAAHDVSPVCFAWALYDEYLNGPAKIPGAEIVQANFAQTLLLDSSQVQKGTETLRRHQLVACENESVRLLLGNREILVETLLSKAM